MPKLAQTPSIPSANAAQRPLYPLHQARLGLTLTAMAAALLFASLEASAQAATAPVAMAIQQSAQPLDRALTALAARTGILIGVDAELVRDKQAPALSGNYTPEQALAALLAGSGLEAGRTGDKSYTVRLGAPVAVPAPRPVAVENREKSLATVTVKEEALSPAARRASDFSAEQASVGVLGNRTVLDTPFSVNVIPSELIKNQSIRGLADLTRADPALSSSFSIVGYYDAVSIRGLTLSNETNYFKNGLRFQNQAKTAFENIDRVEVLRGLSGFMQGFASPGGTVNFVTERPTGGWQRKVELQSDQYGTLIPGIDIGGPITDDGRLKARINLAGGQEKFYVDQVATDRRFASLALDWAPLPELRIQLDAQADRRDGTTQPTLFLNSAGAIPGNVDPRRYLGQPWQTYDTRTRETSLGVDWQIASGWKAELKANKTYLYRDDFSSNIGGIQPNGDFTVFEYKSTDETRDQRNLELALRGDFSLGRSQHQIGFGLTRSQRVYRFGDGVFEPVGQSNLFAPVRFADPGSTAPASFEAIRNKESSVFLSDFISWTDQWHTLLGLRRTKVDFSSVFSDQPYRMTVTTPSAALVYKPVQSVSVYGSYAEGLQEGGTAPVSANNRNQQLDPVTAKQREIGVKGELLNKRLALSAALFEVKVPLARVDAVSNVFGYFGDRQHRGLELTAVGSVLPGTRINAGLVLLNAKGVGTGDSSTEGKIPGGVAERQINLFLDQALPQMPGLSVQFGLRHASRRAVTNDNSVFAPGWTAFDAGVRYATRVNGLPLEVGLFIVNLGDRRYFAETEFTALNFGNPRSVNFTASLGF